MSKLPSTIKTTKHVYESTRRPFKWGLIKIHDYYTITWKNKIGGSTWSIKIKICEANQSSSVQSPSEG